MKTLWKWWQVEARLRTSVTEVQDWKMSRTSSLASCSICIVSNEVVSFSLTMFAAGLADVLLFRI